MIIPNSVDIACWTVEVISFPCSFSYASPFWELNLSRYIQNPKTLQNLKPQNTKPIHPESLNLTPLSNPKPLNSSTLNPKPQPLTQNPESFPASSRNRALLSSCLRRPPRDGPNRKRPPPARGLLSRVWGLGFRVKGLRV